MSTLSGFSDAVNWRYDADGNIVGNARDRTYAQVARDGMPADVLVAEDAAPLVESCIVAPVSPAAISPSKTPACLSGTSEDMQSYAELFGWSAETADDDFDTYFEPVAPRSLVRAKRTGQAKKPSKTPRTPKYGPKVSKLRTVAADLTVKAEAVAPMIGEAVPDCGVHPAQDMSDHCSCCGLLQDVAEYCNCMAVLADPCHHCDPSFASAVAKALLEATAWNAYLATLWEMDRAEERMRAARYDR